MGRAETPGLGGAAPEPRPEPRTHARAGVVVHRFAPPTARRREPLGGGWAGQRPLFGGPAPGWAVGS